MGLAASGPMAFTSSAITLGSKRSEALAKSDSVA